ncbi:MAG: diaminopropionate ammonia-lyase, partial [Alphaproteobacteria bacterium]|nr:diaminopropionate ammonia-lyase [Alphaproteobacteria bacterium]
MPLTDFANATVQYHANEKYDAGAYPESLDAVLSADTCERAYETIKSWDGYKESPLFQLNGLAKEAGIAEILYKHEGG